MVIQQQIFNTLVFQDTLSWFSLKFCDHYFLVSFVDYSLFLSFGWVIFSIIVFIISFNQMLLNTKYHQHIDMLTTLPLSLSLSTQENFHITKCLLISTYISKSHLDFTCPIPYSQFSQPPASMSFALSDWQLCKAKTLSAFFDCSLSLTLHIQSINKSHWLHHKIIIQNLVFLITSNPPPWLKPPSSHLQ